MRAIIVPLFLVLLSALPVWMRRLSAEWVPPTAWKLAHALALVA
jgi:hypothetical protein